MRRGRLLGGGSLLVVASIAAMVFGLRSNPTDEDAPTLGPGDRIRVEVLNAGGVAGAAQRATEVARAGGFDVVYFGNAGAFDRVASEVVDRVGRPGIAQAVARTLGIPNVRYEPDPTRFVDVSVILGSRWGSVNDDGGEGEP